MQKVSRNFDDTVRAKIARLRTPLKAARGFSFKRGKFVGLDVISALDILTRDDEALFAGHKEALFAGFTNWLITPDPRHYMNVRDAIVIDAFRQFAVAEAKSLKRMNRLDVELGHIAMYSKNRRLLEEIYHPIGGSIAVRRAYARGAKRAAIVRGAIPQIRFLVALASLLHHHAWHLKEKRGEVGQRSYVKAGLLVGELKLLERQEAPQQLKKRRIMTYWNDHFASLPILYAASLTPTGRETVLDRLLNQYTGPKSPFRYSEAEPVLLEWLGCAQYLTTEVFATMPISKSARAKFPKMSRVASCRKPPPPFSESQQEVILRGFQPTAKDESPLP